MSAHLIFVVVMLTSEGVRILIALESGLTLVYQFELFFDLWHPGGEGAEASPEP